MNAGRLESNRHVVQEPLNQPENDILRYKRRVDHVHQSNRSESSIWPEEPVWNSHRYCVGNNSGTIVDTTVLFQVATNIKGGGVECALSSHLDELHVNIKRPQHAFPPSPDTHHHLSHRNFKRNPTRCTRKHSPRFPRQGSPISTPASPLTPRAYSIKATSSHVEICGPYDTPNRIEPHQSEPNQTEPDRAEPVLRLHACAFSPLHGQILAPRLRARGVPTPRLAHGSNPRSQHQRQHRRQRLH